MTLKDKIKSYLSASGRWLMKTMLKLSLAGLAVLLIWFIYLDSKVSQSFAGTRWEIPVQVFAEPLAISPGQSLSRDQLVTTLKNLNYQKVNRVTRSGDYAVNNNNVVFYRRAFSFADGVEPARKIVVRLNAGSVTSIVEGKRELMNIRLDAELMARLLSSSSEDREFISLERFPEFFKDTLLLVEDRNFYHHAGVSPLGILRALIRNIAAGRTVQGGSTLTQQLAKNMYLTHERTLWRKINEVFIALILDYRFSKDELLEAYLNEINLGHAGNRAIHGFGLASRFYFGKPINEVSASEAALLVAMVKGPSWYNPRKHHDRAVSRRDLVLRLMFEHHLLSKEQYNWAVSTPVKLATRASFVTVRYPAYLDQVRRELRFITAGESPGELGLRVFTRFDPAVQQHLEKTVQQQIPLIEAKNDVSGLEVASVVSDYHRSGIVAMVGARNVNFAGFNRALNAKRNIGSLIKPAIYLEAFEQDYMLNTLLDDKPVTLVNGSGDRWNPQNYDKRFLQSVTVFDALKASRNIPAVNVGMDIGIEDVIDILQDAGVHQSIKDRPSLLLGALELSPLQVNQFYSTLARLGSYQPVSAVHTITDSKGDLYWQKRVEPKQIVSLKSAALLNAGLVAVANQGTARQLAAKFGHHYFAAKTGTTNDLRDSWFSGYDGQLVTTVWIGKDDNTPTNLTGTQGAMKIFNQFYQPLPRHPVSQTLVDGLAEGWFDPKTGHASSLACDDYILLPYRPERQTLSDTCMRH